MMPGAEYVRNKEISGTVGFIGDIYEFLASMVCEVGFG